MKAELNRWIGAIVDLLVKFEHRNRRIFGLCSILAAVVCKTGCYHITLIFIAKLVLRHIIILQDGFLDAVVAIADQCL